MTSKPLAISTPTPAAERKTGVTRANLDAAQKTLKTGSDWESTTSALVKAIGKPAYKLSPGRSFVDEDWWWVLPAERNQCITWSIGRRGNKLDQFGMVGTYSPATTEEIRSNPGQVFEPCSGKVSTPAQ
jgi:hypothetical protein